MLFYNAFAFLEKEPTFMCQLGKDSDVWTIGDEKRPLEKEFCEGELTCAVDWSSGSTINNILMQLEFECAPKW